MRACELEADGPTALANRMASYITDPNYIAGYVRREYGRAPSVGQIQQMRQRHERQRQPRSNHLQRELDAIEQRQKEAAERREAKQAQRNAEMEAKRAKQAADGAAAFEALRHHNSQAGRIISAVAFAFAMTPAMLIGKRRGRRFVLARQVVIRLLRDRRRDDNQFTHSLPAIGRLLGGRDHSTIKHALDTFETAMAHHPNAAAIYERLKGRVQ